MTYAACETALVAILRGLSSTFATADVGTDYSILDNGSNNRAVVLPGAVGNVGTAAQLSYRTWDLLIDLNIRYTDKTSYAKFAALRDTVLGQLDKYPSLNNTAGMVVQSISSDGDPHDVMDKAQRGPVDVGQIIRVTVLDITAITGGEF
jgi:hypothetical protein